MNESFVRFEHIASKPRTKVWAVFNVESGNALGLVQWCARWRCYAFFPAHLTIFEQRCLRDIAAFCEERTQFHRQGAATLANPQPAEAA